MTDPGATGGAATPADPVAPDLTPAPARPRRSGGAAALVAAGILLSRILGLVRSRVVARFFGVESVAADAFAAALRIPNFLQNLFGEGVLSASFIPVYARLLGAGDEREARRLASAIFGLLALVTALLVLGGVLAAPLLVDLLVGGGFTGERRELTIRLVRIIFPGTGLLVLSAWCLGILNSHGRFFLSYAAPVAWNVAIIAALLLGGRGADLADARALADIAIWAAWGAVVGSLLQLLVQLPAALSLLGGLTTRVREASEHRRTVLRNFAPAVLGRGVAQVSAYVDIMIAGNLGAGAVAGLTYAQAIYLLPVSLFGMAISAAELPAMSREAAGGTSGRGAAESGAAPSAEVVGALRLRLDAALRRVAYFVIPSAAVFLLLGDVVAGAIYQTGAFTRADAVYVWAILAGSAVGLLAATSGRLFSSAFYALHDVRTPVRIAVVRIAVAVAIGLPLALGLPRALGVELRWGVAALTLAGGIAAWVELLLLRNRLGRVIGPLRLPTGLMVRLWACALAGAGAAWGVKIGLADLAPHPIVRAAIVLLPFGLVYLGATHALRVPEASQLLGKVRRR